MKALHASYGILNQIINLLPGSYERISQNKMMRNNTQLPITMTGHLPYFIIKFETKCLPAQWCCEEIFHTPTLTIEKNSTAILPRSCAIQWAAGNLDQTQAVRS